jgi:hypothetical protein
MSNQQVWDSYDRVLKRQGLERTRENWLWVFYDGKVPASFDSDDEMALPPDLRIEHKL